MPDENKKLNILFVISTLQMGGAERVLAELANRWSDDHAISVLTIDKGIDFFTLKDNVKRYNLAVERKSRYNPLPHFKIIAGIKKTTKKAKPDFVISFVGKTNVFTLLALKNTQYKTIVCEHSIINQPDIDKFTDFFRLRLYKKAYKIGVLSESSKKDFIAKYKNCKEKNVIAIPNSLKINDNKQGSINLKEVLKEDISKLKIIVSLGRLDSVKGFDKLIKIFNLLNKKMPNTVLIIFGEGDERAKLEKLIDNLNLKDKVFLPGQIHNVGSALSQASVFACTSEYEGFGMAILEAMYFLTPVISFDVPEVGNLIINNKNGILVKNNNLEEYAKKIAHLLNNKEKTQYFINEGMKTVKLFSPEAIDKIWFEKVMI